MEKTITKKESHHGKLRQLYINDAGDLLTGDQLENIVFFKCTFDDLDNSIKNYIRPKTEQESRLLGVSPTGNAFAITFPPDEIDIYQQNKDFSEKNINNDINTYINLLKDNNNIANKLNYYLIYLLAEINNII